MHRIISTSIMAASLLHTADVISHGMNNNVKRGTFILFEGVDRCGKTTQVGLLKDYYASKSGIAVEQIRFPERSSPVGQLIDSYLKSTNNLNDQAIHLLFSSNRWEQSSSIEEKLNNGYTLICDRYAYSGVAFSSAKGLDLEWCKACDRGLPSPDVIIYLDMPIEEAAKRGNFGEERYERIDFQKKVREQFLLLKQQDEEKEIDNSASISSGSMKWHIIDASKSIDEVHNNIVKITNQVIEKIGGSSSSIGVDNNNVIVASNNNDYENQYIQKLWIK